MRAFLIVLILLVLFATAMHAAFQGSDIPHMRGAPQIEEDIRRASQSIAVRAGEEPVTVRVSGRHVTLSGPVESADIRDRLVGQISALPLVLSVTDGTTTLERADPFVLEIIKTPDGALSITGHVPNRRAENRLLTEAREFGAGARVNVSLDLAAGVPEGDWVGMISTGLKAVARVRHGAFRVQSGTATLSGEVPDAAALQAVEQDIANAPMGNWTRRIVVSAPAGGYRFSARKPESGPVRVEGHAPDEATARRLLSTAASRTGREVAGSLVPSAGMPVDDWPDLATAALAALGPLEAGSVEVLDHSVTLTGTVETDADLAALMPLLDESWRTEINVRKPTPAAHVTIRQEADGRITIAGLLPEGLAPGDISRALPAVDMDGIARDERGKPADWNPLLDGLSIVLPRFAQVEIAITDRTLVAEGQLRSDFSADGVRAALRSALGRDWDVSVRAEERRAPAQIVLSLSPDQTTISGVLPDGLASEEVLRMAGANARAIGLAGGGDGQVDAWRASLVAVTGMFRTFSELSGELVPHRITLKGRLKPGYAPEDVRSLIASRSAPGWDIDLSAEASLANEGDHRVDLTSGRSQTFRNGFWLPDVSFPVSTSRCASEIDIVIAGREFFFESGAASLPAETEGLLNEIAAIAIRCLNSSDLRMEVAGHTASVGNDEDNRLLSEKRAMSITRALVRRGVRVTSLVAVGRGEADPIATNNTPEGRARNERIAFRWLDRDE